MSELENTVDQLDEKKASGEDSVAADAVGGEVPKRRADLKKKVDPNPETVKDDGPSKGPNKVKGSMTEAFSKLFDGEGLSEEFKEKTVAVFEAAVTDKVNSILEEKTKELEESKEAELETHKEELTAQMNGYLDYVVKEWLEDNEAVIESNIKVEVAESFMNGLKTLVAEHNLEITEEENDRHAELTKELEESKAKYDELFNDMVEVKESKTELEKEIAFAEVSEELTDSEAEKLATLAEGMEFTDVEGYKRKLVAIKENYFTEEVETTETEEEILEEIQEEDKSDVVPTLNENINMYAKNLSRYIG